MNIRALREALSSNEEDGVQKITELRAKFSPKLFEQVSVESCDEALAKAIRIIQEILSRLQDSGFDPYEIHCEMEAGHGLGHLVRDYVNGLKLLSLLDADPRHIFIGMVAGALHDIGCVIIPRYSEKDRVIRHAEAGAILLSEIFAESFYKLNPAEKILIAYAAASHTHYLRPAQVKSEDGQIREVKPYQDLDRAGKPILGVWIPRWIDRLDCSGPAFVGRHFLTLGKTHLDFDGEGFYEVRFADHMRPILLDPKLARTTGIKQTMLGHLSMFADSQNNDSPYGEHDFGRMVTLRDEEKGQLYPIIEAVQENSELSNRQMTNVLRAWEIFLVDNIEPTDIGLEAAESVCKMFKRLDLRTRTHWAHGFLKVMEEYRLWAGSTLSSLQDLLKELPVEWSSLGAMCRDIKIVIAPSKRWTEFLES